ncbi:MAG TPA: hypothetical protein VFD75_01060 [Pyrinomonadaceae bacterium]|nr:hypothetical protein [Pyrinomonadaceae bacterium]
MNPLQLHRSVTFRDEPDGKGLLKGTVKQDNVPDKWFMILPVVFSFGKQRATGTVHAYGPTAEFQIRLPAPHKS